MKDNVLLKTNIYGLGTVKRGKVRDIYDLGEKLLIVATDRISAFDVIIPNGIPNKGKILTRLSVFWFSMMEEYIPHHLISTNPQDFPEACRPYTEQLTDRSMLVKHITPLPVECIVRGYLSGSGWKDYCSTGKVSGVSLPKGLKESEKLPNPIFTPSSKAAIGEHDVNITFTDMEKMVVPSIARQLKELSISIYNKAQIYAEKKGVIIADTKMEFGLQEGKPIIIDELLTPDSSRFWPANDYSPGRGQKSMDKQFVRDYLNSTNREDKGDIPELPAEIVSKTSEIYTAIYQTLTS